MDAISARPSVNEHYAPRPIWGTDENIARKEVMVDKGEGVHTAYLARKFFQQGCAILPTRAFECTLQSDALLDCTCDQELKDRQASLVDGTTHEGQGHLKVSIVEPAQIEVLLHTRCSVAQEPLP